jgi:hypothetical protein
MSLGVSFIVNLGYKIFQTTYKTQITQLFSVHHYYFKCLPLLQLLKLHPGIPRDRSSWILRQ